MQSVLRGSLDQIRIKLRIAATLNALAVGINDLSLIRTKLAHPGEIPCFFTGIFGKLGIKTVFMINNILHVGRIRIWVAGQRDILIACQNILNLLDVDLMRSGSICNGNGSSYTCGLTGADTLRNQIDIVDPNFISRDMASGAKQILGLFGQNRTVRNLDGAVIVDKADGRMPCDNILMLFRESKIIGRKEN